MVYNTQDGIEYLVRIISEDDKKVIELNNIKSISTNKSINADTGTFSIVLDYNPFFTQKGQVLDGPYLNALSDFFYIKPMDYVEIYAKHGDNRPFGLYARESGENQFAIHTYISIFPERALDIVERINNPHLLFCGFIDSITNNWGAMVQDNSYTIAGKCLAKFLSVHQLFYNFPASEYFIRRLTAGNELLMGKSPNEAIDAIMTYLVMNVLELNKNNITSTVTRADTTRKENYRHFDITHQRWPNFRYLYWGTSRDSIFEMINDFTKNQNANKFLKSHDRKKMNAINNIPEAEKLGIFSWGRLEQQYTIVRNIFNVDTQSTVMQIIRQSAGEPFNEFFVDELGNMVLRPALKALNYQELDTQDSVVRNWQFLDSSEIKSFNFNISDDELQTIIINTPVGNVIGTSQMIGVHGMVPMTQEQLNSLMTINQTQQRDQQRQANRVGPLTMIQDCARTTYQSIIQRLSKGFDGYDLGSRTGIHQFWKRFGVRPLNISDTISFSNSEAAANAFAVFDRYLGSWFSGTISVRGDSRFKIGQKVKIEKFCKGATGEMLDMYCYVHSVSHTIDFGGDWMTTLNFIKGEIPGVIGAGVEKTE